MSYQERNERLLSLYAELSELENVRINLKSSDFEEISDLYQEKLELGWAINDCKRSIKELETTIS